MFKVGQDVVCIDDNFQAWARGMYEVLPEKGKVYTIREIDIGCEPIEVDTRTKGQEPLFVGQKQQTLYFEKLINKIHPISKKEKGFASWRFAPLKEEKEEIKESVSIKARDFAVV